MAKEDGAVAERSAPEVKNAPDVVAKWGEPVAKRSFAQIPNYLLLINQFLTEEASLSAVELLVLLQIVAAWWKTDDLPYPSMRTLALRSGVPERQVQRAINRLDEIGLIKRVRRKKKGVIASNAYDLSPLVEILNEIPKHYENAYPRVIKAKASLSEDPV